MNLVEKPVVVVIMQPFSNYLLAMCLVACFIWLLACSLALFRVRLRHRYRVPTPGKSWIFCLENSGTWKVVEKYL